MGKCQSPCILYLMVVRTVLFVLDYMLYKKNLTLLVVLTVLFVLDYTVI